MSWRTYAACSGLDPSFFVGSEESGPSPHATKYCDVCVVRVKCLDQSVALSHDEAIGVWGGTRENMRKELRRRQGCLSYRQGCSCAYCKKVSEILSKKVKVVSSNSRGARHGFCSTHARGCRCRACCHAAAYRSRKSKPRRQDNAPLSIVVTEKFCEPHRVNQCAVCIHIGAMKNER